MKYNNRMLIYELFSDIMQREIQQELTEIKFNKNKKTFFTKYFLNMNISVAIVFSSSKYEMWIHEIHMEGSVSRFDIGPSFYLRKCIN